MVPDYTVFEKRHAEAAQRGWTLQAYSVCFFSSIMGQESAEIFVVERGENEAAVLAGQVLRRSPDVQPELDFGYYSLFAFNLQDPMFQDRPLVKEAAQRLLAEGQTGYLQSDYKPTRWLPEHKSLRHGALHMVLNNPFVPMNWWDQEPYAYELEGGLDYHVNEKPMRPMCWSKLREQKQPPLQGRERLEAKLAQLRAGRK